MVSYGQTHCAAYDATTPEGAVGYTYYDAERVFYQIGDYTGNTSYWTNCAHKAEAAYRDAFLSTYAPQQPTHGGVPWILELLNRAPHRLPKDRR